MSSRRDPRIAELVGIARELAEEKGYEAAERLMLHFGGQRRAIPEKMRPRSEFWRVLGPEVAKALAAIAARPRADGTARDDQVDIPLGSRLLQAKRKAAIAAFEGSKNRAAGVFPGVAPDRPALPEEGAAADVFD